MVAPLLIAGGLSTGLSALYHAGKAYDNYRFWNDYYKNTGYRPKYPFRSGSFDYMNEMTRTIGVPYLYSRIYSRGYSRGYSCGYSRRRRK